MLKQDIKTIMYLLYFLFYFVVVESHYQYSEDLFKKTYFIHHCNPSNLKLESLNFIYFRGAPGIFQHYQI